VAAPQRSAELLLCARHLLLDLKLLSE
jgi:hypothetical protein